MNLSGNTILITGGDSGIGFEFAAQLLNRGNTVIITGRDHGRLEDAAKALPGLHTFQSDVNDPRAISQCFDAVIGKFPELNVLINNAGIMRVIDLQETGGDLKDIGREIETNLLGPVRMVKAFLPHLKMRKDAAILNVSSGLAFVPLPIAPIYCAAKAGLHSFTQSLRVQLRKTGVRVFELTPPLTRTPLLSAIPAAELIGGPLMDVATLVDQAIKGLQRNQWEIRPGRSNLLKLMSRVAPQFILNRLSKSVGHVVARTAAAGGTARERAGERTGMNGHEPVS